MGIIVRRDEITKIGLSEKQRSQIRAGCLTRNHARIRHRVREAIKAEIIRLESEVMTLRTWLKANKKQ